MTIIFSSLFHLFSLSRTLKIAPNKISVSQIPSNPDNSKYEFAYIRDRHRNDKFINHVIMRVLLTGLMICVLLVMQSAAQGDRGVKPVDKPPVKTKDRLALVIGNSSYSSVSPLTNPSNDADSMAQYLRKLGFDVLLHKDLGLKKTKEVIADFQTRLNEYEVALFYYAGHAAESKGENYLYPVDASPLTESDAVDECYSLNRLLGNMEEARVRIRIIILDACRNNPFKAKWTRSTGEQGLANMKSSARGTLIAFAAQPGATAEDGKGKNGTYTQSLIRHLTTVNQSVNDMFTRVTRSVKEATGEKQEPYTVSSLDDVYYLNHDPNAPMAPTIVYVNQASALSDDGKKELASRKNTSSVFNIQSLNGIRYEETTSNNYISFTGVTGSIVNFSGKLLGYAVSGKMKQNGKLNFQVTEGNATGNLSFSADGTQLMLNMYIKEARQTRDFSMKKKK